MRDQPAGVHRSESLREPRHSTPADRGELWITDSWIAPVSE
jgi:hypothetical protein